MTAVTPASPMREVPALKADKLIEFRTQATALKNRFLSMCNPGPKGILDQANRVELRVKVSDLEYQTSKVIHKLKKLAVPQQKQERRAVKRAIEDAYSAISAQSIETAKQARIVTQKLYEDQLTHCCVDPKRINESQEDERLVAETLLEILDRLNIVRKKLLAK